MGSAVTYGRWRWQTAKNETGGNVGEFHLALSRGCEPLLSFPCSMNFTSFQTRLLCEIVTNSPLITWRLSVHFCPFCSYPSSEAVLSPFPSIPFVGKDCAPSSLSEGTTPSSALPLLSPPLGHHHLTSTMVSCYRKKPESMKQNLQSQANPPFSSALLRKGPTHIQYSSKLLSSSMAPRLSSQLVLCLS